MADDGKGLSTATLAGRRPSRGLPAGDQQHSGEYDGRPDGFEPNPLAAGHDFEVRDQAGNREVVRKPAASEMAHNPIKAPARRSK